VWVADLSRFLPKSAAISKIFCDPSTVTFSSLLGISKRILPPFPAAARIFLKFPVFNFLGPLKALDFLTFGILFLSKF
jgi:hypothetical protein